MTAYYNEIDPYAAAWLRNLIAAGHIAAGVVDERSIEDVRPSDLAGFTQCHFFAGIGVWSLALRRAGWPDDRAVWTGSCPCQPFSAAGQGGGFDDERHLWPAWHWLIEHGKRRSIPVLGEQVASRDGLAWLDLVLSDLEDADYAAGAVDLCAAGVGAPHIRQRLWFVAYADSGASGQGRAVNGSWHPRGDAQPRPGLSGGGEPSLLGNAGGLADTDGRHASSERQQRGGEQRQQPQDSGPVPVAAAGPTNGLWRVADWLLCRDGRWRPVEPGTFPLAHGAAARVGRLRAYGNAINVEAARVFIEAADALHLHMKL